MDKKIARELVRKVGPLEHSNNPKDRAKAKKVESRVKKILRSVPKPKRLTA